MRKALNSSSGRYLIASGLRGGLGHKYTSIFHSILTAIHTNRSLYSTYHEILIILSPLVHVPLVFWEGTSTCLIQRQFTGEYYIDNTYNYPVTKRTLTRNEQDRRQSIASIVGNYQVMVMKDFRPSWEKMIAESFEHVIMNNPYLNQYDFSQIRKRLARILLNPTPDILDYLDKFKQMHYVNRTVLALQLRTGGCLANVRETSQLISNYELKGIPEKVQAYLAEMNHPIVYLSTDSDYAEAYLRSHLAGVEIQTSSSRFARTHSSGFPTTFAVKSALVDMFLLADSDVLMASFRSGFGKMASLLTRARTVIQMDFTHTRVDLNNWRDVIESYQV